MTHDNDDDNDNNNVFQAGFGTVSQLSYHHFFPKCSQFIHHLQFDGIQPQL